MVVLQNAYGVEDGYIPSFEKESFRNCHTGRRLRNAIPDGLDISIINASPKVGKKASSNFRPEHTYVSKKLEEIAPDMTFPEQNQTVAEMAKELRDTPQAVWKLETHTE